LKIVLKQIAEINEAENDTVTYNYSVKAAEKLLKDIQKLIDRHKKANGSEEDIDKVSEMLNNVADFLEKTL
jgi:hypothetical protein